MNPLLLIIWYNINMISLKKLVVKNWRVVRWAVFVLCISSNAFALFLDITSKKNHWLAIFPTISILVITYIYRDLFYQLGGKKDLIKEGGTYTEPILAWRVWRERDGLLDSVFHNTWPWLPGVAFQTILCYICGGYKPTIDCSCGVYGRDYLTSGEISGFMKEAHIGSESVLGLVYFWGKVIRHENGYRAECAYPAMLFVTKKTQNAALIVNMANKYNIPFVYLTKWERFKLKIGGTSWISESHKKNLQSNLSSRLFPQDQLRSQYRLIQQRFQKKHRS